METDVTWTIDDPDVASIDKDGNVLGLKAGTTNVKASIGDIFDEATLIVKDGSKIEQIEVLPDDASVKVGESIKFYATAFNWENKELANIKFSWSAEPENLGTIDQNGNFTAISAGICMISASFNDISYSVNVVISPLPTPPPAPTPACIIKVMPENLFFGKIARGKEMTLPFILTIPEGIAGKLMPSEQWIEVSPSRFEETGDDIEGFVTIKASALPAGESFEGFIEIIPDDTNCSPIKMKVIVKTDKSIQLKLVVGDSKARLNSETIQLDVPPQIINGRTLIPVRFISESFGCVVGWDASSGKITISRGDFSIVLFKDKKTAYINGEEFQLDVPATIVSGRTLVPVRFISEGFGAEVSWEGETKTITIDWNPF